MIVSLDDATIKYLEKKWPWDRKYMADALTRIAATKPAVIGIDFIFSDRSNPEQDLYLTETIQKIQKNIPLVFASVFIDLKTKEASGDALYMLQKSYERPFFDAETGFVNIEQDRDRTIRKVMLANIEKSGTRYLFFSLALFLKYAGATLDTAGDNSLRMITAHKQEFVLKNSAYINYYGYPGSFTTISLFQVLRNDFDPKLLKDKIVLFGPGLTELKDYHYTSFHSQDGLAANFSGIEILSTILSNLLKNEFITYPQLLPSVITIVLHLILFLTLILTRSRYILKIAVSLGLVLFYNILSYLLFSGAGIFMPTLLTSFYLLIAAAFFGLLWQSEKRAIKINEMLKDFQGISEKFIEKFSISSREKEIIEMLVSGDTNQNISKKLYISLSTVKKHVYNIYQKVSVNRRDELIRKIKEIQ